MWGGTLSSVELVRLVGPGGRPVTAFLLENILIRLLLPRLMPMSRLAGREMMEVVEADLWCGSSREARSSLAVLTASSAPRRPGMTESILCLAVPAVKMVSDRKGGTCTLAGGEYKPTTRTKQRLFLSFNQRKLAVRA